MPSVFTHIINGDLPGRFVWKDGVSVGFMTIAPVTPGHVLVVPRKEIDHWEQIDTPTFTHMTDVSQKIGRAVKDAFDAPRMGMLIAGLEVPHLHIHVFPAHSLESFDLTKADQNPSPESLDDAAERIRVSLRALGYGENVPD
ncbi:MULTISPECIES: HIT family protein [Gordonia]|uniref:HIT family protein n=2 Tax=Gordonia TaxID=2053 RepID=L7LP81_9ACTN|nr:MULTISPECIES: HIT family protein [Gordonia]AUH67997.1 HIT family protein [Gordonia sp. YC-JH1]KJR05695.1 diadenosine tetraphosphate hydrolase [Gordonia sihwensis]KXT58956.1 diadenosine tetraphosphate hydrolase [Gordonia sp. QH-12]MBY4569369.1 HIT family protein [Gordonia sihwensis]WFN92278.1 HIT family protein [Gordonia sihwensis]